MFGLHQVLTPIHIEMINQDHATFLLPVLAMAGAGQVGAALALWVKCRKNQKIIRLLKGALPAGILGIGEPLIYGNLTARPSIHYRMYRRRYRRRCHRRHRTHRCSSYWSKWCVTHSVDL